MNYHLVILKKPYLDLIVSGRKTIELRLSKGRQSAFGHVHPGDRLFLKISSGPVCAVAAVADVRYYEGLARLGRAQSGKGFRPARQGGPVGECQCV